MAIIEERCYVLHTHFGPKDYFDLYKGAPQKLQGETLGGFMGYYVTEVGQLNALVSLWRYESFEERQKRRAQLAAEPEWLSFLSKVRPMIRSMENRLLVSAI
jgi:hypothetical protein